MNDTLLKDIHGSLLDGDQEKTLELVQGALGAGLEPMRIIDEGLIPGMNEVGDRFSSGEFFLPHLVVAGSAMQQAMMMLEPELAARQQTRSQSGVVVLGTVKGDIHAIGKSLVGVLLSANGFKVHDLGVDVDTPQFIEKARDVGANLIGLSALLTTTMTVQQDVIEALEDSAMRAQVKVMIGGAPVNQEWCESIGADGYAEDAAGAVVLARSLMT
jgi:corrinoid protein of di/trimethylamine methyltransferase